MKKALFLTWLLFWFTMLSYGQVIEQRMPPNKMFKTAVKYGCIVIEYQMVLYLKDKEGTIIWSFTQNHLSKGQALQDCKVWRNNVKRVTEEK